MRNKRNPYSVYFTVRGRENEIIEVRIALIPLISFYRDPENEIKEINGASVVFGSFVTVWAEWVEVEGSSPKGGILSQMCECV